MKKKSRVIFIFIIALCMMFGTTTSAIYIEGQEVPEIETGEGYINIVPLTGIELDDVPENGGEETYIPEEYRRDIEVISEELEQDEERVDVNVWIFVGAGVGILVLIGIVIFLIKKK